jgi:hypothetical protein
MKFFEPCTTMPAWQAWVAASAVVITLLCVKLLFHQVLHIFYQHVYCSCLL